MLPYPLILSEQTGELIGARYYGERQVIHAFDDDFAAVLNKLTDLSDGDLSGISCDDSGQRWVVSFTHDREPGVTYFYDRTTDESRLLFRPYPNLDPDALAPMTPVTITARDGLDVHGYLTLPVGREQAELRLRVDERARVDELRGARAGDVVRRGALELDHLREVSTGHVAEHAHDLADGAGHGRAVALGDVQPRLAPAPARGSRFAGHRPEPKE